MTLFSADQFFWHLVGDYTIQSDWMAQRKTKEWVPAIAHAFTYAFFFTFLTWSPAALFFIFFSHLIIDHYRLARYVCFAKNYLFGPRYSYDEGDGEDRSATVTINHSGDYEMVEVGGFITLDEGRHVVTGKEYPKIFMKPILTWWMPWSECDKSGYHKSRPDWLAYWLLFICDNTLHLLCNALALHFL